MSNTDRPTFDRWLGLALGLADVTPPELAESIGHTPEAVRGWLRGARPSGPSVARVLHALGMQQGSEQADAAWRAYHETVRRSR